MSNFHLHLLHNKMHFSKVIQMLSLYFTFKQKIVFIILHKNVSTGHFKDQFHLMLKIFFFN